MVSLLGLGSLAGGIEGGLSQAEQMRQMQQERQLRQLQMLAQQRQLQQQQFQARAIGAMGPGGVPGLGGPPGAPPGAGPPGAGPPPGAMPQGMPPAGAPGAVAPPMGAAPAPVPTGAPPPAPPPDQTSFDQVYTGWIAPQEGGFNRDDAGAGPTNFGINSRANPGVDVSKITPAQAKQIMQAKYWNPSGAGKLPPDLAAIQMDTAVLMGPGTANQLLKKSGGDPAAYLKLREQAFREIANRNPAKASSLRTWLKRNGELGDYAASLKLGGGAAEASAAGGPAAPGQPAGESADQQMMGMYRRMQEETSPASLSKTIGAVNGYFKEKFPDANDEQLGWMTQAYFEEAAKVAGTQRQTSAADMLLLREGFQNEREQDQQAHQDARAANVQAGANERQQVTQEGQDRRQKERLAAQQKMLDERLAQSSRQFEERERDIDARLARRTGMADQNAKVRMAVARVKTSRQAIIDQMSAYKTKNGGVIAPDDGNWAKMQESLDQADRALMDIQGRLSNVPMPASPAPAAKLPSGVRSVQPVS